VLRSESYSAIEVLIIDYRNPEFCPKPATELPASSLLFTQLFLKPDLPHGRLSFPYALSISSLGFEYRPCSLYASSATFEPS